MIDPSGGVPNPLVPFIHNWKGGPYNEGSLFHGPIYTRPMALLPYQPRPLYGADEATPMQGLGQELVDTRYGSFATPGYGQGIFNLNTAFGAADETSPTLAVPGSLDVNQILAAASGPSPIPLFPGMPTPDQLIPLPAPGQLPMGTFDQRTLQLQFHLNQKLLLAGFYPLTPDGSLGPKTCGALKVYNPLLVPVYAAGCTVFEKPLCYRPDKECGFPNRPDLTSLPSVKPGATLPGLAPCKQGQTPTLAKPCVPTEVFPPGTPGAPAPTVPTTSPGLPGPAPAPAPGPTEPVLAKKPAEGVSTAVVVAGFGAAAIVLGVIVFSMKR